MAAATLAILFVFQIEGRRKWQEGKLSQFPLNSFPGSPTQCHTRADISRSALRRRDSGKVRDTDSMDSGQPKGVVKQCFETHWQV